MGLFSFLFGKPKVPVVVQRPIRPQVNLMPVVGLAGDGEYGFEVVGESHRQAALNAICGGKTEDGHEHECMARLVPEPDNQHDPNAVKVMIEGRHVAYLARADAQRFNRQMRQLGHGGATAACAALINGGWRRERAKGVSEGDYGVELDLIWPLEVDSG